MDTLCPNIVSFDGYQYKTSLICLVTGLVFDIYSKTRDAILPDLIAFVRLYRRSIHVIQCDNAGEFHDSDTGQAVAQEGVYFFFSVPRKSYYNGKVERYNRWSTVMSNTFRFAAGGVLPIMWTASHRIAKHIHNRIHDSKGRHAPLALTTGYTQNIG